MLEVENIVLKDRLTGEQLKMVNMLEFDFKVKLRDVLKGLINNPELSKQKLEVLLSVDPIENNSN